MGESGRKGGGDMCCTLQQCCSTCLRILKLLIFYNIFYACLIGFFSVMWGIFSTSIIYERPQYILSQSLIGEDPGLAIRPRDNSAYLSNLIYYRVGENDGTYFGYTYNLDRYLRNYQDEDYQTKEKGFCECPEGVMNDDPGCLFCKINTTEVFQGRCTSEAKFGFPEGRPCILLKLNKIWGWMPTVYQDTDQIQSNIPQEILERILGNTKEEKLHMNNKIWVHCEGKKSADKEYVGDISYFPDRGFGAEYFPYVNQDGYLSPVVFVAFDNPMSDVLITIECRLWTPYAFFSRKEKIGIFQFELLIGNNREYYADYNYDG